MKVDQLEKRDFAVSSTRGFGERASLMMGGWLPVYTGMSNNWREFLGWKGLGVGNGWYSSGWYSRFRTISGIFISPLSKDHLGYRWFVGIPQTVESISYFFFNTNCEFIGKIRRIVKYGKFRGDRENFKTLEISWIAENSKTLKILSSSSCTFHLQISIKNSGV